ncbi:MAG: ABC transporter permease [Planctomycetes bacterium]|nr:ABC transporter permease [Planctomycetota bacterium]
MYALYLGLRYMVSRPVNLLGIGGVTLGVWALIVIVSIFSGYITEVRAHVRMASADIVAFHLGPQTSYASAHSALGGDANVADCAPRLLWPGLIHPPNNELADPWIPGAAPPSGRFVTLTGIDPVAEARTSGFASWLLPGPAGDLDPAALAKAEDWILVSSKIAAKRGLSIGDRLVVTSGGGDALATHTFRVAGTFATKHTGFDNHTVFVSIGVLRTLLGYGALDFVNEIAIKLHHVEPEVVAQTGRRLTLALLAHPEFQFSRPYVLPQGEQERDFLSAVDHQRGLMKMVLFVIMVIAAFLVYATLSMMVTEKTHDIGVLAALGATRDGVLGVFSLCGLAIALVGTTLGVVSGCLTSIYLDDFNTFMARHFDVNLFPTEVYNLPRVPYALDPWWIGLVAGSSLVLCLLAAAIPALRAMRRDPLECLRTE